jgi:diguanylate cyclase (GGDEF)-like protein
MFPTAHWTDVLIESMIFLIGLLALWFIRNDRMRAASRVVLSGLFIAVSLQTYFIGDPANDIAGAAGLQLFAILAVLLLEKRDRLIAALLALGAFIGLNLLATYGNLLPAITLTPMGKVAFSLFMWLSASIIISLVLIAAMGAMRREPQLLDQQLSESEESSDEENGQANMLFRSTHDELTGLYNRLFFDTEFTRLSKSRLFPISIIIAAINDLEDVNKTSGLEAGDRLVINIAVLFSKVFRQEDIVSRYSEDEFAVLLPSSDETIVEIIMNRIGKQMNQFNKSHKDMPINISIGTATAKKGESLKGCLKKAKKIAEQKRDS